jgi:hypothetical protein
LLLVLTVFGEPTIAVQAHPKNILEIIVVTVIATLIGIAVI